MNTISSLPDTLTRSLPIILPLLLAGCFAVPEIGPVEADSFDWTSVDASAERRAIERAQSIDRSTFDEAWTTLRRFGYTRNRMVVVRDANNEVVGRASSLVTVGGSSGAQSRRVVSFDSTGTFEHSFWSRFSEGDSTDTSRWPTLVLPEDPLFLAPQGPSYFRYTPLPDTSIGSQIVEVLLAQARPETSRRGIQQAKMYLFESDLVGLEVVFVQQSLLYKEFSRLKIILTHPESDVWVPGILKVHSTVGLPFSRARTYELESSFGDFRPLS